MKAKDRVAKLLPAGWRIVDNPDYVSPLDAAATALADCVLSEYNRLFGLYTKSDSQVVVTESVPDDATVTRACTLLHERGYRVLVNWVVASSKGRTASFDVFEYGRAVAETSGMGSLSA